MSRRSSAKLVSYDLRPAKQTERRILIDLLRSLSKCGIALSEYRYVGMGANRFYDYLLIFKYLGIRRMISLEHDKEMCRRAEFNCPYGFIEVLNSTTEEFIDADEFDVSSILWLDYDAGINAQVISDIASLGTKLRTRDVLFLTVAGGVTGALSKKSADDRVEWLRENLGEVAGSLSRNDVETSNFHSAVAKILNTALTNSFCARDKSTFVPLFRLRYSDGQTMISLGGIVEDRNSVDGVTAAVSEELPFLSSSGSSLYEIRSLNITERERNLLDRAVTVAESEGDEFSALIELGFKEEEIANYRDLCRYLPRYFETIV